MYKTVYFRNVFFFFFKKKLNLLFSVDKCGWFVSRYLHLLPFSRDEISCYLFL